MGGTRLEGALNQGPKGLLYQLRCRSLGTEMRAMPKHCEKQEE